MLLNKEIILKFIKMDNNNPAEMTNEDLEKDMQKSNDSSKPARNQENVNKSTATEGELKTPSEDTSSAVAHHTSYNESQEQDLDDLVHRQAEEETHNGNLPNPEDIPGWEGMETDDDKIGG